MNKFIFWTPRLLSIFFILFLSLFSLDVFEGHYGFLGTLLALLIHNIPTFILVAILIISWKHELVGIWAFTFAGLSYVVLILIDLLISSKFEGYMISWSLIISGPLFLIAYLFYLNWKIRRKRKR